MAATKRANSGTAKKPKLGQNFLADVGAAEQIVDALGDVSNSVVVAIGPLNDLRPLKPSRARVVGNLPYYITSDILLRLFEFHAQFDVIVIMVQREVADRIAAHPGTRDYGMLSATAQLYTKVENLFTLPPEAFLPPPKVHSSVLRLTVAPRFAELQVNPAEFIAFLKTAFAMKRKTLLNNLKKDYREEIIRSSLKDAGVRADVRAEALPLETTAQVFRKLTN